MNARSEIIREHVFQILNELEKGDKWYEDDKDPELSPDFVGPPSWLKPDEESSDEESDDEEFDPETTPSAGGMASSTYVSSVHDDEGKKELVRNLGVRKDRMSESFSSVRNSVGGSLYDTIRKIISPVFK